jgi:hypothetical protein
MGKQEIYIKFGKGGGESLKNDERDEYVTGEEKTCIENSGGKKYQKVFSWKTGRWENNTNMDFGKAGPESCRLM